MKKSDIEQNKSKETNSEQNIPKENKFYVPKNQRFSKSMVLPLWQTLNTKSYSKYTNEQIDNMLKNPYASYKELQSVSNYLWATCPMYQNIIFYHATIMSFDYLLYPEKVNVNNITLENRLISSAKTVKESQVKSIFPTITLRTLLNGETYWYDLSDSNNTIYAEIDSTYCQLAFVDDDNLWRYFVDLSRITVTNLYELPDEIRIAYDNWVKKGKNKQKTEKIIEGYTVTIPDSFYLVGKKGFSLFAHMKKAQHDYPFLASMFTEFNSLEDNKDYFDSYLKENNIKIIHLKIPIDKDTGKPLMDEGIIRAYHESAKEHLPSNVAPMTNPFEVEGIALDKSQQTGINLVEHSKKIVQDSSGISETIFSASTTNGLKYSTTADAVKMYPLLYFYENLINYKIKSQGFRISFLQINHYDRLEWHKQYSANMAVGGLRNQFISTSNIELYDFLMISKMEKLLNFDDYLPVKMSANQMNSDDVVGRKELDAGEKADSTVIVDNYR